MIRATVASDQQRPDCEPVQTVEGGGCGVRLPAYPGEPPPKPIGRRIAGSPGSPCPSCDGSRVVMGYPCRRCLAAHKPEAL